MTNGKHLIRFFGTALVLFGLAACGDNDDPTAPQIHQGTMTLKNNANTAIVEVQIAACSETEWGPDRLGSGETIGTGQARVWKLETGCYDIRASTGQKAGYWYDRYVAANDTIRLALSTAANSSLGGAAPDLLEDGK